MKNPYKWFLILVTAVLLSVSVIPIAANAKVLDSNEHFEEEPLISKSVVFNFNIVKVSVDEDFNLIIDFYAQNGEEGKLVFGGTYTLQSGETLGGDLVVMGGEATLEQDSTLKGAAVVFGGTMQADGKIEGDVVTFGGKVKLGEDAIVGGDVISIGGELEYEEETQFEGEVIPEIPIPFDFSYPQDFDFSEISFPQFARSFNPLRDVLWFFLRSFMWTAVAVLLGLFFPNPLKRVSDTVISQPIVSGGLGLLTAVIVPILLVLLAITLICLPISLILLIVLAIAWVFGIVAIGLETGQRISKMINQVWAPAVSAGIGTLILTFVLNGIGLLVPWVGWIIPALVGMVGMGAVLLTRFGSNVYPDNSSPPGNNVGHLDDNVSIGNIKQEMEISSSETIQDNQSSQQEGE